MYTFFQVIVQQFLRNVLEFITFFSESHNLTQSWEFSFNEEKNKKTENMGDNFKLCAPQNDSGSVYYIYFHFYFLGKQRKVVYFSIKQRTVIMFKYKKGL